jgi:hypothetical protein
MPQFAKPGAKDWNDLAHRVRTENKTVIRSFGSYVEIPTVIDRGVDRFRIEAGTDGSVIGNLDYTFGAEMKGADISGTTTDSIYILKYAAEASRRSEKLGLLQLLPIATMVPAGHHSLMECAYPLTREGYINYQIGYYETLVPKAFQNVLDLSELANRGDEIHVVVSRDWWGREAGLLMNKRDEIDDFRKMAGIRAAYSFCSAGILNGTTLLNVMESHKCKVLLDHIATPV